MGDERRNTSRELELLGVRVAERLAGDGWSLRDVDLERRYFLTLATLTGPVRDGVMAVLGIEWTRTRDDDAQLSEVRASLGIGYEPALNLMPLLTLPARPAIITDPGTAGEDSITVPLGGPASVPGVTDRIVDFVEAQAPVIAARFPDAASIEARLRHEGELAAGRVADKDDDRPDLSQITRSRLVLLAAAGRADEARAVLTTYRDTSTAGPRDRAGRRFVRQLTRWLDAGSPPAPPAEETLALLPRRPPLAWPKLSWSAARARGKSKREAQDAVRAQSRGKTPEQLRDVVAAEYEARGLDIAPSLATLEAEMLLLEQKPFGRARQAFKAAQMVTATGGALVRAFRHGSEDPEWLQPPERAAYPMIEHPRLYTPVDLDPACGPWLDRAGAAAPRHAGPLALIEVWLTRDGPDGPLVAHVGDQRVGTVPGPRAATFDPVLRAAVLFDEDPVLRGRLTWTAKTGASALEIPLPAAEKWE